MKREGKHTTARAPKLGSLALDSVHAMDCLEGMARLPDRSSDVDIADPPYPLSPRAMRRTFNDLARDASIEAIVTRSISGHLTEQMQNHYSTVRGPEQRAGIARVVDLMTSTPAPASEEGGMQSGTQAPGSGTHRPRAIH